MRTKTNKLKFNDLAPALELLPKECAKDLTAALNGKSGLKIAQAAFQLGFAAGVAQTKKAIRG
jgi:hypothetical protein